MQNPILKLEAGSFIFEKAGYFPEKLKHLTSSNYIQLIFFAEILRFRLTSDYKRVFEIFFLFRSWVIGEHGFCECTEAMSFLILANN